MYFWIKAFHIISVMSWMAGLLYLPRLFIYHVDAEKGSKQSETFKIMERRLMKIIMTPAMLLSWFFGLALMVMTQAWSEAWFVTKLLLLLILSTMHFINAKWMKEFANDNNQREAKFYRIANEIPTVLMILIVILAVVKPF
jgi:putative membrane protein